VKLDYLKDGSDDCPLVRLYEFRSEEILRVRHSFERLANGVAEHVALDEVVAVESIDGTRLTFSRAARDRGVVPSGESSFDVVLTPDGWQSCIELVEPFCKPGTGYQWLCDGVGHIRLLLSRNGSW